MDVGILKQASEHGVVPFLFTLVLIGVGLGAWKIGLKIAEAIAEMVKNQNVRDLRTADTIDRIGDAVEKISTMTAVLASQAAKWEKALDELQNNDARQTKATRIMLEALREVVPAEKTRVLQLLELARQQLES